MIYGKYVKEFTIDETSAFEGDGDIFNFLKDSAPMVSFSMLDSEYRDEGDPSKISFALYNDDYLDGFPLWEFSLRDLCGPAADFSPLTNDTESIRIRMRKIAAALRDAADELEKRSYLPDDELW